jgi:trehalose synthase
MKLYFYFLLFSIPLLAEEEPSLLFEANTIIKKYALEVAKAKPPLLTPQTQSCLDTANVWFSVDLASIIPPAFDTLAKGALWDQLREIGVQGVVLQGLKKGGAQRTAIALDPKWGKQWNDLALLLQSKNMVLITDSLGPSTGLCADFHLALKNVGEYAGLYQLIEIEKNDWNLLPKIESSQLFVNIPWLQLQKLHKKGYVPQDFSPYIKSSSWNATASISCVDGKVRRWIYQKENKADPLMDWLNPSFAATRIAAADILDSVYNLGQKMVQLNPNLSLNTKETLSLLASKLGNFSIQKTNRSLQEIKSASADLCEETLTKAALLHALLTQDTEVLKLIYRLFLEEEIDTKKLVHTLQPLDQFSLDWSELLVQPRQKLHYYDEILTAEALRMRLLKQDALSIVNGSTWTSHCAKALGIKEVEKYRDQISEMHLLLAFFYAMQPGVFSFSVSDLLGGIAPNQLLDPMKPNENTLYASLPNQLTNAKSFATQLKKILSIRRDYGLESAELLQVPKTKNPGLILFIHKQKQSSMVQILAVNFGKQAASEILEMNELRQTTPIDLMSGLALKKPLDSSLFELDVPALTGKIILFQTKYYD